MTMKNTKNGQTSIQVATQQSAAIAEYTALIDGINTELTGVDVIYVDGTAFKKADLVGKFQKRLDAAKKTRDTRSALLLCVEQEKEVKTEVDPLRNGTKAFLKTYYGKQSSKLQKYGFAPDRTPVTTPATKAEAVKKAEATRQARGTAGKVQKARIKAGAQPAATPSPEAAPAAAPAPSPAPAVTAATAPAGTSATAPTAAAPTAKA
jgi:hypothetical protein